MRPVLSTLAITSLLSASGPAAVQAQNLIVESEQTDFRVAPIASGLEFPWSMAFLPNGDMLISEREGRLRYLENGVLRDTAIAGLPDDMYVDRQGGLLDVALHPDFESNRWIYVSYAAGRRSANHTALARGRLSEDGSQLTDVEVLFRGVPDKERGLHFGGRIQFLADTTVLLTLGDGFMYRNDAQTLDNHLGKIVRLNDDGSVPFDNPYASVRGVRPEIFTRGHRNVQGIAINPATGSIWAHEHGPRGGDEINTIEPASNYGWPDVTYGVNYDGTPVSAQTEGEGYSPPIWYWVPSIAPSGMAFYSGEAFAAWQGDVFVGALAGTALVRYEVEGDRIISEEVLLEELQLRIRDVRTGPDGLLYLLTDDRDGQLLQLRPADQ